MPEGPSARGFWAGPIITSPDGYPGPAYGSQFSYEVATPEEAREPGKLADIIIVDGDRLTDFGAIASVVAVITGGELAHSEN